MSAPVTLVGNLVEDPELRFTPQGAAVASFRLAVDERRQNPQTKEWEDAGASFYRVTGWRSMAENVAESLRRGTRVIVVGDLVMRSFERQDGTKGLSPEVTARSVGPDLSFATASVTRTPRSGAGDHAGDHADDHQADHPTDHQADQRPAQQAGQQAAQRASRAQRTGFAQTALDDEPPF